MRIFSTFKIINTFIYNFTISLSILMHEDANQMEALLRAIYRTHNIYCIHVDDKSSLEVCTVCQCVRVYVCECVCVCMCVCVCVCECVCMYVCI